MKNLLRKLNPWAQVRALRADNERLMKIIENPELVSIEMANGTIDMKLRAPFAAKFMAWSFWELLGTAPNWQALEIGPMDHEGTMMMVTVRRADGTSPEEMVGKLKEEIEHLRSFHRDLLANTRELNEDDQS